MFTVGRYTKCGVRQSRQNIFTALYKVVYFHSGFCLSNINSKLRLIHPHTCKPKYRPNVRAEETVAIYLTDVEEANAL